MQRSLDSRYKPTKDKLLLKVAGVTALVGGLIQYYLWDYFQRINVEYSSYFDANDAIAMLNKIVAPLIYVTRIMTLYSFSLIPVVVKKRNTAETESEQLNEDQSDQSWMGLSNAAVIILVLLITGIFYVFLDVYEFDFQMNVAVLILTIASCISFLYWSKNWGTLFAIVTAFVFTSAKAKKDVASVIQKKEKSYLMVRNYSVLPVLTEDSKYRYLIGETTNYKFIKDECENKIYSYSESTGSLRVTNP
ncbi:hypothetical protein J2810_002812 [Chryseobacterium rhizosphaerae]|uniref:hypothetical protein n=1 Tax=Chryseobacterium rhizosphaerae TaxID=395937 RepID=UPI0028589162|nr:hypothetical protein [Chryseobacterium rhizosphaerae]MDR6546752.1 hypothetical protein [Chryseobacterium rhizosphaerae]